MDAWAVLCRCGSGGQGCVVQAARAPCPSDWESGHLSVREGVLPAIADRQATCKHTPQMSVMPGIRRKYGSKILLGVCVLLAHGHAHAQAPSAANRGYMYLEGGGAAGESKDIQIARAI